MHQETSTLALGILVGLFGLQCWGALYLFSLYRRERRFYRTSLATGGTVIESRRFSTCDGPDFLARISYSVEGTEYMLKGDLWSNWRHYKRGDRVTIRYLAGAVGNGRVERPWEPYVYLGSAVILLLPMGLMGFLLAREFSR